MFEWLGTIYKFIAMRSGYSDAMRIITTVSFLPTYAYLRQKSYLSVIFVETHIYKVTLNKNRFRI